MKKMVKLIAKSRLVRVLRRLCAHMLKNEDVTKSNFSVCGCGSYCLEHIFDWVWVQKCVSDSTVGVFFFARKTTFHLQMFDKWHNKGQKYYYFQFVKQNFKNLWYPFWALSGQMQIETQWNENYFILFCNGTKIISYFL